MTTLDDLLKWDDGEKELDLDSGLRELPIGKWCVLQAKGGDESGASAVDPPEPKWNRDWYRFRLGLRIVGGEEDGVPKAPYRGAFHQMTLDTKEAKGQPSPKLKAMINMFFGQGLPHGSDERIQAARKVLNEVAKKYNMDPSMADSDGIPIYPDNAVYLAAVFAKALGDLQPRILAKPYLSKGKKYVDKQTGEEKVGKDRIELGNWTDYTPENLEEKGCVVWDQPEGAVEI